MCSSEFLECLPFYETFFASSSAIHEIPCCWLCCLHSLGGTKWTAQVKMCHDDAGWRNEREKGLKSEIWWVLCENLKFNCRGLTAVLSKDWECRRWMQSQLLDPDRSIWRNLGFYDLIAVFWDPPGTENHGIISQLPWIAFKSGKKKRIGTWERERPNKTQTRDKLKDFLPFHVFHIFCGDL